jgi:hypothetical protein
LRDILPYGGIIFWICREAKGEERMDNTERGIEIVAWVANQAVLSKKNITHKELATILNILGHKTSSRDKYSSPGALIKKARDKYNKDGDKETAENIRLVFSEEIDISLLLSD